MDVPAGQHISAVFLLTVIDFRLGVILLQKTTQGRNFHCFTIFNETIFWQSAYINEKPILLTAITAAIEHNAHHKAATFHLILKLAGNIGGKVLSTARIRIVFVHIRTKITVQCALRFLVGCLIKVAGIRLAQQHNLQSVDYSGFAGAVLACQEVDVTHLNEFLAEVQPVNQQDLLQLLHRRLPPFAVRTPHRSAFHWKQRPVPWVRWKTCSYSG